MSIEIVVIRRFILVFLSAAALLSASDAAPDRDVLNGLNEFKQAVVDKDRPALEKLLHPGLSYGHTDGHLETKDQVLERVADPKVKFSAIDVSDAVVRVYGTTALVTAKLSFHREADGKQSISTLSTLDVWLKGPEGWQLVGRQLTRPPQ